MWMPLILLGLALLLAGFVFLFMPKRMSRGRSVLMAIAGVGMLAAGGSLLPENVREEIERSREQRAITERQQQQRQQEQQQLEQQRVDELKKAVASGLADARLPAAQTIEITDSNRLVATFEIDDAALATMVAAGITSPK